MKTLLKTIAVILSFSFGVSFLGFNASSIVDKTTHYVDEKIVNHDLFNIPDIIDEHEIEESRYIRRKQEQENDLYTLVFENEDGSNTLRVFGHPVKYINSKGEIRDISLQIAKNGDESFKAADHEMDIMFEPELSNGINLKFNDINIKMMSKSDNSRESKTILSDDGKKLTYVIDDKTSYVYSLTYCGIKEDIVVSEYTGQTEYEFILKTNGLHPEKINDSVFLVDENKEIKASIGDIIVFTADNKNNTLGNIAYETVVSNEEYVFTILLESDYLKDEKTVYPITIDPTIEINYDNNGAGAIEDVTINSLDTSAGSSGSLYVGLRNTYGKSRILMRFPNLNLTSLPNADCFVSASVELKDLLCETEMMTVDCHVFTGNAWSENNVDWQTVDPDNYGEMLSQHDVSYDIGHNLTPVYRYSFSITNAVKGWKNGNYDQTRGIIFKAPKSVEDNNVIHKTFASYNRTASRPSFKLTYTTSITRNLFYSTYNPLEINSYVNNDYYSALRRMNCYGYAFKFISYDTYNYRQQPGEFASTQDKGNTMDLTTDNALDLMNRVVWNMQLDAARLGYTVTEYTDTAQTIAQASGNMRIIAVVTGTYLSINGYKADYHFYVQHSDGMWSHKPGNTEVSNVSSTSERLLTNENIRQFANEGIYANGPLKFFYITKSSVTDYPHEERCCNNWPCTHTQTALQLREVAGDHLQTSKTITTGNISCRIDYCADHDIYCYTPTESRLYTITTTCSSGANLNCKVFSNNGYLLTYDTYSGQVNISIILYANQNYYFDIYNSSYTITPYTLSIS